MKPVRLGSAAHNVARSLIREQLFVPDEILEKLHHLHERHPTLSFETFVAAACVLRSRCHLNVEGHA
jgi:hypothetical protein